MADKTKAEIQAELDEANTTNAALVEENTALKAAVEEQDKQLQELNADLQDAKGENAQLAANFAAMEKAAAERKANNAAQDAAQEIPEDSAMYVNNSKVNIFTEAGRVLPGATVVLTEEQAKQYRGLDLCQNSTEAE